MLRFRDMANLGIRRSGSSMNEPPGVLVASVFAMASTAALASASGDQNVAFPPVSNKSNEVKALADGARVASTWVGPLILKWRSFQGHAPSSSGSPSEARADVQSATEDVFAPRFDGLRFIETLVTAHR
ncbi:hypothetical protein BT93_L5879 [Corymbia citriodora subsp. variegata]|uniref:Uncharacterized protein n=1 Tax=Corymbia citriodora subsp. variegata TaxID=360336 RepID=A0A8T0CSE0_CORYI|nr:hypothetical protein BT93_L5879 [Corymbia citriodora subsp. variegata]